MLVPELAFAEFPPNLTSFSSTITSAPCLCASRAALIPANPPPITITLLTSIVSIAAGLYVLVAKKR